MGSLLKWYYEGFPSVSSCRCLLVSLIRWTLIFLTVERQLTKAAHDSTMVSGSGADVFSGRGRTWSEEWVKSRAQSDFSSAVAVVVRLKIDVQAQ